MSRLWMRDNDPVLPAPDSPGGAKERWILHGKRWGLFTLVNVFLGQEGDGSFLSQDPPLPVAVRAGKRMDGFSQVTFGNGITVTKAIK